MIELRQEQGQVQDAITQDNSLNILCADTLEALERGGMVKDYNSNSTNLDSEDEEDPRTPASVSSQGSQGYGSTESDFVDIEGFQSMQDTTSLPELNLTGQVDTITLLPSVHTVVWSCEESTKPTYPTNQTKEQDLLTRN